MLKFGDSDETVSYSKIGSWISKIDQEIERLEDARRAKIDAAYTKETVKQRKKRVGKDEEWEFIKLHQVRPNFADLQCINQTIADCAAENNIAGVKGVYRLKGSNIAICDLCKKLRWEEEDIKIEIENAWNETKSHHGSDDDSGNGISDSDTELDLSDDHSDSDDQDSDDDDDNVCVESDDEILDSDESDRKLSADDEDDNE